MGEGTIRKGPEAWPGNLKLPGTHTQAESLKSLNAWGIYCVLGLSAEQGSLFSGASACVSRHIRQRAPSLGPSREAQAT